MVAGAHAVAARFAVVGGNLQVDKQDILESLDRRYADLWDKTADIAGKSRLASEIIARLYDDFYHDHLAIPEEARRAFEARDWQRSLELSRFRIEAFGDYRDIGLEWFRRREDFATSGERLWEAIYRLHLGKIAGVYQGDIAYAFLSSIRRGLTQDLWRVVDYSYARATGAKRPALGERPAVLRSIEFGGEVQAEQIVSMIEVAKLEAPFRDICGNAAAVAARINARLGLSDNGPDGALQIVDGGFFRNRGGYIVGQLVTGGQRTPLALALLNEVRGIYVDAVIFESDRLHYIFSSSLANFHSTNPNFHEVVDFLYQIMPKRPRGLHYATIGYNHVGKLAVLRQIERNIAKRHEVIDYAPGPRGSVAIGFTTADLGYVMKVVRDAPTDQYKWGSFPGVDAVLAKYREVHEINRAGSMLDNVIYDNAALPVDAFCEELLEELLAAATGNVRLAGNSVVFRHLIVQMKMIPLPRFLAAAEPDEAREAISSLGRCIKNNAAANIFNKDLDGRNYGVGPTLKVYLFDYDAVEPLTEVKVRTNADRLDGEEDIPDWFFEDGTVFLPEEIELHLRLQDRRWRQAFREEHGDLLQIDFWEQRQAELAAGQVPRVSTYPNECRLAD